MKEYDSNLINDSIKKIGNKKSEEKYNERTSRWQELCEKAHSTALIIIAKQRHGPFGTIKTHFESNYKKFSDLSPNKA